MNLAEHASLVVGVGAFVLALLWFLLWLLKGLVMHMIASWAARKVEERWKKNAAQWVRPDEWKEPDE